MTSLRTKLLSICFLVPVTSWHFLSVRQQQLIMLVRFHQQPSQGDNKLVNNCAWNLAQAGHGKKHVTCGRDSTAPFFSLGSWLLRSWHEKKNESEEETQEQTTELVSVAMSAHTCIRLMTSANIDLNLVSDSVHSTSTKIRTIHRLGHDRLLPNP